MPRCSALYGAIVAPFVSRVLEIQKKVLVYATSVGLASFGLEIRSGLDMHSCIGFLLAVVKFPDA